MISPVRKIIHVDMDCFYAAIEMRDNPKLLGKPVAVGGDPNKRGVISTCSYEARKFGVHSAMSSAYAMRICPELLILPVSMEKYRAESHAIREIFVEYTDIIEPLSLDEAFLDVTHSRQYSGSATRIAQDIRARIWQQHHLTASAGIAANKFLAKVASEWHKPDGQLTIPPEDTESFVNSLPVGKIFGVGKVTARKLKDLGINTCADLQSYSRVELTMTFGKFGDQLFLLCRGIDDRAVEPGRIRKSLSVEETFEEDLVDADASIDQLGLLVARLKQRLLANHELDNRAINSVFVKIKFSDFTSTTVQEASQQLDFDHYKELYLRGMMRNNLPVRLLGVGVQFQKDPEELKNLQLPLNLGEKLNHQY